MPAPSSPPVPGDEPCWHALSHEEALTRIQARAEGLTEPEIAERRQRYGANALPPPPHRGPIRRFLQQFANLLILVLVGAALVTASLQHWMDTTVILIVVLVNAIIGFVQEGRAERALSALRDMLAPQATVIRDGRRQLIPAVDVVPGDCVLLEAGDRVPADLRLLEARALRVQEAVLTGESVPVDKMVAPLAEATDLADRANMAYSGTLVAAGQGIGLVVATGSRTELGRIGRLLSGIEAQATPLIRKMDGFAKKLTVIVLAAGVAIFGLGLLGQGHPADALFMAVVGLTVAAIPEGLPTILTITLAIGVTRMARRHAIVRRLPAVEALGAVTVICTDKTGTLTRNEMMVASAITPAGFYRIDGEGYRPDGTITRDQQVCRPADHADLQHLAQAARLCNDAALTHGPDGWSVQGDPMEGALLSFARKVEGNAVTSAVRTDALPFDADHRFMATLHPSDDGGWIAIKGAPEVVLAMCSPRIDAEVWHRRAEDLAGQGQRLLAFARLPAGGRHSLPFDAATPPQAAEFLGLVGLIDPPRAEAQAAIADCQSAGIRVKMITGDHAATACAIGAALGLRSGRALTGAEIAALDDRALAAQVSEVDIFARASPDHKLRLVTALQERGQIVAMTGDGVNDAPALRRSDVGVAMGGKGTEAAKQAAEMVLADDNFVSIAAAIREGRTVYDNLTKAIQFLLPINGGESLVVAFAILAGFTLPITAVQILWVNMVSSVTLAMSLAFEPSEPKVMHRPPRPVDEPILSRFLVWRIVFVTLVFVGGTTVSFFAALERDIGLEAARTVAVNTLVALEVFYLFSVRYLYAASISWTGLKGTPAVLIAVALVLVLQLSFTYLPPLQAMFGTAALGLRELAQPVLIGVAGLLLFELEKLVRRRKRRTHG